MFDPVHNGHLRAALAARDQLALDEVRLMPCARPVHRGEAVATDADRLAMLELAVAGKESLQVDPRECRRDTPSWTVHSLETLKQENPEAILFLIMGTDTFGTLETWHRWPELFSLSHLVLVQRPGFAQAFSPALTRILDTCGVSKTEQLEKQASGLIFTGLDSATDLSSTEVRTALENAEHHAVSLQAMLPGAVLEYIQTRRLYLA
jgi:nicotinate-nucleotide adenylyltransferase